MAAMRTRHFITHCACQGYSADGKAKSGITGSRVICPTKSAYSRITQARWFDYRHVSGSFIVLVPF